MKILTKNIFYVKGEMNDKGEVNHRLWHLCKNYKGGNRGDFRIELSIKSSNDDEVVYACPHCDFTYTLDKFLNLA